MDLEKIYNEAKKLSDETGYNITKCKNMYIICCEDYDKALRILNDKKLIDKIILKKEII